MVVLKILTITFIKHIYIKIELWTEESSKYSKAFDSRFSCNFIVKSFGLSPNSVNIKYEDVLLYEVKHICSNVFLKICLILVFQTYACFRITMSVSSFLQNNPFFSNHFFHTEVVWPLEVNFSDATIIASYFPPFQIFVLPKDVVLVNDINTLIRSTKLKFERNQNQKESNEFEFCNTSKKKRLLFIFFFQAEVVC